MSPRSGPLEMLLINEGHLSFKIDPLIDGPCLGYESTRKYAATVN